MTTVAAIVTKPKVARTILFTLNEKAFRWPMRSHGLTVCPAASPSSFMTREEGPRLGRIPQRNFRPRLLMRCHHCVGCQRGLPLALTLQRSPSCGSSLRGYLGMRWSHFAWVSARLLLVR